MLLMCWFVRVLFIWACVCLFGMNSCTFRAQCTSVRGYGHAFACAAASGTNRAWRCYHLRAKFLAELIIWVRLHDSVIMQVVFNFGMFSFDLLAHCGARA